MTADSESSLVQDRSIGDLIREHRNLSIENVEQILAYQREHGVRFGEAAIALGLATTDQVMAALSQQFQYSFVPSKAGTFADELVVLTQPFTAQAEAFRAVRSRLLMTLDASQPAAIAVLSPDEGDGKSYFAANLAAALAQLGRRTLLIDADMRHPRQHSLFKLTAPSGLSSVLVGRVDEHVVKRIDGLPNLYVMPVGGLPPNPLELLERPTFELLIKDLVAKFDHVIVDTPAAAMGSDAVVTAARCGIALVVARRDASRLAALKELTDALSFASVKVAGLVYNEFSG